MANTVKKKTLKKVDSAENEKDKTNAKVVPIEKYEDMEEDLEDVTFELPAGYIDDEGTLHKTFTLREMTGKDEEAIRKPEVEKNTSKVIYTLLFRCVKSIGTLDRKSLGSEEWGKVINNLLVGDQDYILIKLRGLSIGETIKMNHVCPSCGVKLETEVDLDELEFTPFQGNRKITFELPRGFRDKDGKLHREGTLRLPTGFDRIILTPLANKNLAKAETTMLTRLMHFNDGAYIDEDIVSNFTVKDRNYLSDLLKDNTFGYSSEIEVTCDSCGQSFTGNLSTSNFI
jgi:hypothetical protein